MKNYRHTTHYSIIGKNLLSKDEDFTTIAIINSSEFIRNMMNSCEMFRIQYAEFMLIWYKNKGKARLTISKSIMYE